MIPDIITKESKDARFYIKIATWNNNQSWSTTTLNLGNSSKNSMFLNFTTKSYNTFNSKVTFFPFLSNYMPIYSKIWYRWRCLLFYSVFLRGQEILSRKKVIKEQDSTFEMADVFELHEFANRSFTWSKYGCKCLFLFQKGRTVEVKFKERKMVFCYQNCSDLLWEKKF